MNCNIKNTAPSAIKPCGMISGVAVTEGEVEPLRNDFQANWQSAKLMKAEKKMPPSVQTMSAMRAFFSDKADASKETRIWPPVRSVKAIPQNMATPMA